MKLASGETVIADEVYIRESVLVPSAKIVAGYTAIMPTFKTQVNEEQILQLIAYLKSLAAPEVSAPGKSEMPAERKTK